MRALLAWGLAVALSIAPRSATAETNNWTAVFAAAKPSIVRVVVRYSVHDQDGVAQEIESTGSGFIVSPQGYVITNHHVIQVPPEADHVRFTASVGSRWETERPFTVVSVSAELDIALLVLAPRQEAWPALAMRPAVLSAGTEVRAIGFPGFSDVVPTAGQVQSDMSSSQDDLSARWQLNMALNPGNSGGPILDGDGCVVAIVAAMEPGAQAIGYAIPVQHAAPLLAMASANVHCGGPANSPVVSPGSSAPPPPTPLVVNALLTLDTGRIREYIHDGWDANSILDADGNTGLHNLMMVCERFPAHPTSRLTEMAQILIAAGADKNALNLHGDTPLRIARVPRYCGPNHPVVAYLVSLGAQ